MTNANFITETCSIVKGPGKFDWAMAMIDGKILSIGIVGRASRTGLGEHHGGYHYLKLRLAGVLHPAPDWKYFFWGYIELTDKPTDNPSHLEDANRLDENVRKGLIQFVAGMYYFGSDHRGYLMPCGTKASELMEPFINEKYFWDLCTS